MGRLSGVLTVINIVLYLFLLFLGDGSRTAFAMLAVEFVVGFDDTLDEFVADNVLFLEFDFADSLYAFQDLHELCGRRLLSAAGRSVSRLGNDHFAFIPRRVRNILSGGSSCSVLRRG